MTDEDSRKAYLNSLRERILPLDYWLIWQAAVEWATKRERERCAKIIENNGAFWNLVTDHEDWARIVLSDIDGKEPQP